MFSLNINTPNPEGSGRAPLARIYNDALLALAILSEAAEAGSCAAREKLHRLANDLVNAAGRYGLAA